MHGELSEAVELTCGVPQGSNLGSLLFLIYINDLPNCLKRASPRCLLMIKIHELRQDVTELESIINSELKNLHRRLIANRLSSSVAETEFMIIGSRQRLMIRNNKQMNIEIDEKMINRVEDAKSLGLQIDEHLVWARHVESISKGIASAIGALKRIRQLIDPTTALKIYGALIKPYFDFCSLFWNGLNMTLKDTLQKLQNRPTRVITKSRYDASSSDLFCRLSSGIFSTRRKKHEGPYTPDAIRQRDAIFGFSLTGFFDPSLDFSNSWKRYDFFR